MPEWLDNLYAQKKGAYQGVRKQYRVCQKAIRTQKIAYNELERSIIAYHRMQAESIAKIDNAPAINHQLLASYERVQTAKQAHDTAMADLHASLPTLFEIGNMWLVGGILSLHTVLDIPFSHIASAFGMQASLLRRWLRSKGNS